MRYLQAVSNNNKVKIDSKDKKILSLLSLNARIPLTQISKKVSLSRDAVNYRITNLEKSGTIQGYRVVVDMSKLGYQNYHMFVRLNNPSPSMEKKIISKLTKHSFVRALIKFSGNFDFEIALVVKDQQDLDLKISLLTNDFKNLIQDFEILSIIKTYSSETFPPNFTDASFRQPSIQKKDKIKCDKKDIKLLKILGENASLPLHEIGHRIGLSADAVSYRMRNLIASGIIIKFIPIINYTSLDYNLHTLLLNINNLDAKKESLLSGFLSTNENILWSVKTIGRFNVLIYILVNKPEAFQQTLNELRSLFPNHISRYESLIAFEEYKYLYLPPNLNISF